MSKIGPLPADARSLSHSKALGWGLLAVFVPVGGWLLWRIGSTVGLGSGRLWELLRTDPVFGFAMLDFFLTASFVAVVLIERADPRDWRNWLSLIVFCAVPTLGIVLFLLVGRTRRADPSGGAEGADEWPRKRPPGP